MVLVFTVIGEEFRPSGSRAGFAFMQTRWSAKSPCTWTPGCLNDWARLLPPHHELGQGSVCYFPQMSISTWFEILQRIRSANYRTWRVFQVKSRSNDLMNELWELRKSQNSQRLLDYVTGTVQSALSVVSSQTHTIRKVLLPLSVMELGLEPREFCLQSPHSWPVHRAALCKRIQ